MKNSEDIYQEAEQERKKEMKQKLVQDVGEIFKGVMQETNKVLDNEKRKKIAEGNAVKVKFPFIWKLQKFVKVILIFLLLLMFINLILFNIWLFKYFIVSIF